MPIQIIDIDPRPDVDNEVKLDGIAIIITQRWNETAAVWVADIKALDDSFHVRGLALMPGTNILNGMAIPQLGGLFISDVHGTRTEPTYMSLGDQHILWYVPRAELDALFQTNS